MFLVYSCHCGLAGGGVQQDHQQGGRLLEQRGECHFRVKGEKFFVLGEGDKCGGSPLLGGDGGEAEASKAGDDPRQGRSCCRRLHRQAGSPDGEGEGKPFKKLGIVDTNCRETLSSTEETRSTRTRRGEQRL